MPCSGCSALHGVNPNWKKKKSSCKGIGGHKKTQKISKGKTTTLMYFDNLKKKQQDQGGKNWY